MRMITLDTETDPTKSNRFLLLIDLVMLEQMTGNAIGNIGVYTLEDGDTFDVNPHAHSGGVIIPLHGCVRVTNSTNAKLTSTDIYVSTKAEPFSCVVFEPNQTFSVTNLNTRETRVLCLSGNEHPLLDGTAFCMRREDVLALFGKDPAWIYMNNITLGKTPVSNHYHQFTHEFYYPVYGVFEVHLLSLDTGEENHSVLMADADVSEYRELHVKPRTAHAIINRDKHDPLARLLVISTSRPQKEDTIHYMLISSS